MRFGISDRLSTLTEDSSALSSLIESLAQDTEVKEQPAAKKAKKKPRKRGGK
jgi:hypothetical protein